MNYIENIMDFWSDVPSAVTLGKFDGLHRGHQKLIKEVLRLQKQGYAGIVVTIAPDHVPVLLMPEEKRKLVEMQGIDRMIRCPFIPEVLGMAPETFIADILVGRLKAAHIVVGTDFRFGYHRAGDVRLLEQLQEKYGYQVHIIEKECHGGREISSTYVKEALAVSDIELVNDLLGYEYPVHGVILHGKQLGRRIGMPTINLIPGERKLLPPQGVYFSRVLVQGKEYGGMTNIGFKPTVDGSFLGVETYLYGANENLYGCEAQVHLLKFRRPEQKFHSVEELKAQMEQDIEAGRNYFRNTAG